MFALGNYNNGCAHIEVIKFVNDHLLAFCTERPIEFEAVHLALSFTLQISYEYLIVALGLELHYEKVN